MREIRFKAWHKKEQKMYDNVVGIRLYPGCIDVTIQDEGGFTEIHDVDLIQYIGNIYESKDLLGLEDVRGEDEISHNQQVRTIPV